MLGSELVGGGREVESCWGGSREPYPQVCEEGQNAWQGDRSWSAHLAMLRHANCPISVPVESRLVNGPLESHGAPRVDPGCDEALGHPENTS